MKTKIHLLLIDPQNDFMDIKGAALPVPGADADMKRVAALIDRLGSKLDDIHVTLDSHNPVDIAHPSWWVTEKGESPAPFTSISAADVQNGVWRARNPLAQAHSLKYVQALEANQRYQLLIWPEHCLIGSWGHNVHADVFASLGEWARNKQAVVDFVTKGSNPLTEHYSAVQAEVPDASDPSTTLNSRLVKTLEAADMVLIAGEALSHCVASTVRDIADNFGDDSIKKLVLLTDCASSVQGFEGLGQLFITDLCARGMQVTTSVDFLA
ncbi:isochorismatase family protein [Paraburkholderia sp. UCT31]|uniref:isochorismatase family protein n=1 Tax=Paraburkholderia sp. UCT31 TaxID=2615209 RepID=UPI0016561E08|nr:isochorismatase family protein [Paraburkholderia sp. UCT31]MBC8742035.1 isochorismatase family protein [Paraburkholderia sp. UCT31]